MRYGRRNSENTISKRKSCETVERKWMPYDKAEENLLDIILEEECASCKEIYYKAANEDDSIGIATVYRMINLLEEIGAINRKNMYRIDMQDASYDAV